MTLVAPAAGEIVVVVGPTASGKSALALRLCAELDGEIVGADSVQVYRRFDVGSGKASAEERARVPHHLIDVVDPLEAFDASRFAALADAAIAEIRARGRVPVVCGGTFLWVKALLFGLAEAPPADPEIRARHAEIAARDGRGAIHAALAAVDPTSAARLAPNDFVRTSRALEVYELSGRPLSAWHAEHAFRAPRHVARLVGVRWSNDALAARIAARTRAFLAAGFVDEVRALVEAGLRDARAMSSVGYREVLAHVDGKLAEHDLADEIDRATKVFARRQRTWLREQPVTWLDGPTLG